MRGRLLLVALIVFLVPLLLFGATTGKIKGKITDKENGEALVGATVVVVGTSLGAAANVEGEYVILNVPAGTYDLQVNFVGYQSQRFSNVVVNTDLTTELNFSLSALTQGVTMKEIVIQVERELVNKNITNTVRIGTGEDIKNLPVRGVTAAVALNPGVVLQNGRMYIRGGRTEEVGYYLEGADARNPLDGSNVMTVIPEAIEEFQVQSGGYTAQYGSANSGIVRQTLRSGGSTIKATLQAETDNFTSQNNKRLGTYSYGYSNYVATLSGPIVGEKVKFFIAGENQFDRDWGRYFWDGFRFENLPMKQGTVVMDTMPLFEVPSGNIPQMMRNRYTFNGTLTFDYNPVIVRLGGSYTSQKSRGTTVPVLYNWYALQRLGYAENSNMLINAKLTHIVSPTVLYEVNLNYGEVRAKNYDPDFGDDFLFYNDSLKTYPLGYNYRGYTTPPQQFTMYGFPFNAPGTPLSGYGKNFQRRYGLSADATAQVGSIHELKFGGSMETYVVRNFGVGVNLLTWYRQNPDWARTASDYRDYQVRRNGGINNYGYDVYGNELDGGVDGPKKPWYFSGYIQDKIEYSDLVVNAGLRYDYFNNDDFEFIDDPTTPNVIEGPDNPSVDAISYFYKDTGIKKIPAFTALSPRLGLSFPITDRTVFHLQWGKFVQQPRLDQLYAGRGVVAVYFSGGNYIPNPVGRNLDPVRTTQYDVGFTQQFSDVAAFDVTAYYKDISGQIQLVRQNTTANSYARGYNTLVNGDFATTKGFELSLRLRRVSRLQAQVNYTYADAKGTGSVSNSSVGSVENGTQYPTVISPLDFTQAHRGSVNIDYRWAENDGGPILQRLGFNVLFTFNSGHPYTLSTGGAGQQGVETGALLENDARTAFAAENANSSTTPWNFVIDLRIDKTVGIGPLSANFYVYVQNLLNTKNVLNVYKRSGNAEDDGFLSDPNLSSAIIAQNGPGYADLYRAIDLGLGQHYKSVTGLDLWGTPRQIRFGVKLEY